MNETYSKTLSKLFDDCECTQDSLDILEAACDRILRASGIVSPEDYTIPEDEVILDRVLFATAQLKIVLKLTKGK